MIRKGLCILLAIALSFCGIAYADLLVGEDSTGWGGTTNIGLQGSGGDAIWQEPETGEGFTAVSSGTAITAHILISDWTTATNLKIVVYNAARTKLAESAVITSAGGTGERTASISVSITSGLVYFLVAVPQSGYFDVVGQTGSTFQTSRLAINYTTPDDPLPTASVGNTMKFAIWLESADSGGLLLRRRRAS